MSTSETDPRIGFPDPRPQGCRLGGLSTSCLAGLLNQFLLKLLNHLGGFISFKREAKEISFPFRASMYEITILAPRQPFILRAKEILINYVSQISSIPYGCSVFIWKITVLDGLTCKYSISISQNEYYVDDNISQVYFSSVCFFQSFNDEAVVPVNRNVFIIRIHGSIRGQ